MRSGDLWKILPYGVASYGAYALLLLGAMGGPLWTYLALVWVLGFSISLGPDWPETEVTEARFANALVFGAGCVHFAVLMASVWSMSTHSGGTGHAIVHFLAVGLCLGQVSNAVGHELIHRRDRAGFFLGKWIFISLLFGHHTSAHRLVHHVHVATPNDPNTARWGQSFYRFAPRAYVRSFTYGKRAENMRNSRVYAQYTWGGIGFLAVALVAFGWLGLLIYVGLCAHAITQLLMSDYVQHYGLRRARDDTGTWAKFDASHSWEMDHLAARWLMFNAPRHAAHHNQPSVPFHALRLSPRSPKMPHSLAVMGFLALFPGLWRRRVHPLLAAHAHSLD